MDYVHIDSGVIYTKVPATKRRVHNHIRNARSTRINRFTKVKLYSVEVNRRRPLRNGQIFYTGLKFLYRCKEIESPCNSMSPLNTN